jgi:hypothetical protein
MNWEAIGAVAELVGALAVIVTIAFLAVQVRQNTAGSVRDAINETTRIMASDPEAARIFWAGLEDRSALTDRERYQFDALMSLTFFGLQEAYQTSAPYLAGLRWVLGHSGARDWWGSHSSTMPSKFRNYVDEILNKQPPAV